MHCKTYTTYIEYHLPSEKENTEMTDEPSLTSIKQYD